MVEYKVIQYKINGKEVPWIPGYSSQCCWCEGDTTVYCEGCPCQTDYGCGCELNGSGCMPHE